MTLSTQSRRISLPLATESTVPSLTTKIMRACLQGNQRFTQETFFSARFMKLKDMQTLRSYYRKLVTFLPQTMDANLNKKYYDKQDEEKQASSRIVEILSGSKAAIYDDPKYIHQTPSHKFQVLQNRGGGNCLFICIAQFLNMRSNPPGLFSINADEIRKQCVHFIVQPDPDDVSKHSNWRRFRMDIQINLKYQNHFFRNYDAGREDVPDDDKQEVEARKQYENYMRSPGNFGTATELAAAMDCFKFSVTMIQQKDEDLYYFDIYHLNQDVRDSSAFILFTGDPSHGHFELLQPLDQDRTAPPIVSQVYKVVAYDSKYMRIKLAPTEYRAKPLNTHTTLKRRLNKSISEEMYVNENFKKRSASDDDLTLFQATKKSKFSLLNDSALVHPTECLCLVQHYNEELTKLRDDFTTNKTKQYSVADGITKSASTELGKLRTTFVCFQPEASSDFSVANYDVNYIVCSHTPITVRILVHGCCGDIKEKTSTEASGAFQVIKGTKYALENQSKVNSVLLRIFWITT